MTVYQYNHAQNNLKRFEILKKLVTDLGAAAYPAPTL